MIDEGLGQEDLSTTCQKSEGNGGRIVQEGDTSEKQKLMTVAGSLGLNFQGEGGKSSGSVSCQIGKYGLGGEPMNGGIGF